MEVWEEQGEELAHLWLVLSVGKVGIPSVIEACAGILETENAEEGIKKECTEETGYHVDNVQKVFEAYMSPGSVTEILHFFVAEYDEGLKQSAGGGVAAQQEEIEILELAFNDALGMIGTGEIRDGKTIMLLYHAQVVVLLRA